jgi:hypothetical protein
MSCECFRAGTPAQNRFSSPSISIQGNQVTNRADAQLFVPSDSGDSPMPQNGPPQPEIELVEVETSYVLGFPMYVALTVRSKSAQNRLPWITAHNTKRAIGLRLTPNGQAQPIKEVSVAARYIEEERPPVLRLPAGGAHRFLFDLSPLLPEQLAPGIYELELSYGNQYAVAHFRPVTFIFRAPTSDESRALVELRLQWDARRSYANWVESRPDLPPPMPTDKNDPMRYPRLVRFLKYGAMPLREIDPHCLDVLDGLFEPEKAALLAELLAVRDKEAFARQVIEVKNRYPGLTKWMDDLANGRSEIQWERAHETIGE